MPTLRLRCRKRLSATRALTWASTPRKRATAEPTAMHGITVYEHDTLCADGAARPAQLHTNRAAGEAAAVPAAVFAWLQEQSVRDDAPGRPAWLRPTRWRGHPAVQV